VPDPVKAEELINRAARRFGDNRATPLLRAWNEGTVREMIGKGHALLGPHSPAITQAQLAERILNDTTIHSSTRWYSEELLVQTVTNILNEEAQTITGWLADVRGGKAFNRPLAKIPAGHPIGEGYVRVLGGNATQIEVRGQQVWVLKGSPKKTEIGVEWIRDISNVTVVLKPDANSSVGFSVLTAYPDPL
jgi:hypothetical protein